MSLIYKSRQGLQIHIVKGAKSATDKIIEIRKGGFRHRVTLEEMAVIIGEKALNEDTQYPREYGYDGYRKPLRFITEYTKRYVDDPRQDLSQLIGFLERRHQIVQYSLLDGWQRKRTRTG